MNRLETVNLLMNSTNKNTLVNTPATNTSISLTQQEIAKYPNLKLIIPSPMIGNFNIPFIYNYFTKSYEINYSDFSPI